MLSIESRKDSFFMSRTHFYVLAALALSGCFKFPVISQEGRRSLTTSLKQQVHSLLIRRLFSLIYDFFRSAISARLSLFTVSQGTKCWDSVIALLFSEETNICFKLKSLSFRMSTSFCLVNTSICLSISSVEIVGRKD